MRTKHLTLISASGLALASLLPVQRAHAQAMDYGSLQDLFGEPVTTSATGTPQKASQVATSMTIITADEIRRAGTRDIAQIVGIYAPGIDILRSSEGGYEVGVRGYQQAAQPRILVLVDGRQVFIDDYSRTEWNNIPVDVDDIRQIEVIRGAASALFGSNAAGGAINIVTNSPIHDHSEVATVSAGTQGGVGLEATDTFNGKWGGTKISGGVDTANGFGTPVSAADSPTIPVRKRYVGDTTVFQVTPTLQVNLEGNVSTSQENTASPNASTFQEFDNSYEARGGFAWQSKLGTISSDTYYNGFNSKFFTSFPLYEHEHLLVSTLQDRFSIGSDHVFRVLAEYRGKGWDLAAINQPGSPQPAFGRLQETTYAIGGSWLWQVTPALSWTNAVRVDHETVSENGQPGPASFYTSADYRHPIDAVSANSGLAYQIGPNDEARLTYGRGIILPSMIQQGFRVLVGPFPAGPVSAFADLQGNPYLEPTVVSNYEIGYGHHFEHLHTDLSASVFYGFNQNILSSFIGQPATRFAGGSLYLLSAPAGVGNSRSAGGEVELKGGIPSGLHWDASYSYVDVMDSPNVLSSVDYGGSSGRNHVRLSGGTTLGHFDLDANMQYISGSNSLRAGYLGVIAPVPVEGYVTFGGRIAYRINKHLTIAAYGTQLNSPTLMVSPYARVERQAFISLTAQL